MRPGAAIGAALGGGVLFGAAGVHLGAAGTEVARVSILGATLGALAYCDVAEHRIPNRIVVPASAACAALLFSLKESACSTCSAAWRWSRSCSA